LALRKAADVELVEVDIREHAFFDALLDDLNTPNAIAQLHSLFKQLAAGNDAERVQAKSYIFAAAKLLGILEQDVEQWLAAGSDDDEVAAIDQLIVERAQAKADKNWARADEIRDELSQLNIIIEDGPSGTTWRKA